MRVRSRPACCSSRNRPRSRNRNPWCLRSRRPTEAALVVRNGLVMTRLAARTRSQSLRWLRGAMRNVFTESRLRAKDRCRVAKLAAPGCNHTRRSQPTTGRARSCPRCYHRASLGVLTSNVPPHRRRWLQIHSAIYSKKVGQVSRDSSHMSPMPRCGTTSRTCLVSRSLKPVASHPLVEAHESKGLRDEGNTAASVTGPANAGLSSNWKAHYDNV
jgi:hypothetical protein